MSSTLGTIDREFILDIANEAKREGNHRLRDILLAVAGMLGPTGKVVSEPCEYTRWGNVMKEGGKFGVGLSLSLRYIDNGD